MQLVSCTDDLACSWFWNWAIAFVVPYLTDEGQAGLGTKIAFIWFATSFGAAIWTYFCVPETKGHSLEELDEMFASGIPYRQVRPLLSSFSSFADSLLFRLRAGSLQESRSTARLELTHFTIRRRTTSRRSRMSRPSPNLSLVLRTHSSVPSPQLGRA